MNYWDNVFKNMMGYYQDVDSPSRLEIVKHIKKTDSVLDIGCGAGTLAWLIPDNDYYGIDYSYEAIKVAELKAQERKLTKAKFALLDTRTMPCVESSFDVVVLRHTLENQSHWDDTVRKAFKMAKKKVIINMRRNFVYDNSRIVEENNNDTWLHDINIYDFNLVARNLSVNVSYGKVEGEEFVIIGKKLDEAVVTLDDFHDKNHNLDILDDLKRRFPKFKATLFAIPSKCSINFLKEVKSSRPWIDFGVHGWFHDTEHGTATECNYWTEEEAKKYIGMAEDMGVFNKVFRAPGWNYNIETYRVLLEKGYTITDHLAHDRYEELGGIRYTTGNLAEVHGHVQFNCNMNGLDELSTTKCNFSPETDFFFIDEFIKYKPHNYLPNRYQ